MKVDLLQNELGMFEEFTSAVRVMDNDHAYIHQGIMFVAYTKVDVISGGEVEFAFKTPAVDYMHYRLASVNPSADKVETFIYEDATYTGGTLLAINNKERNSANTSGAIISQDPTFSDDGTLLPGFGSYLPGAAAGGQRREGTDGQADSEIVLKQDTVYRFLLTNGSSTTNTIGINFKWYEEVNG